MKSLKITIEVTCMVPNSTKISTDIFGELYIKNTKESLLSCPEIHGWNITSEGDDETESGYDQGKLEDFIYKGMPKYTTTIILGDEKRVQTKHA